MKIKKYVKYWYDNSVHNKKTIKRLNMTGFILAWIFCWWTVISLLFNDYIQEVVSKPFEWTRNGSKYFLCKIFHPKLVARKIYKKVYMNEDQQSHFDKNIFIGYDREKVAVQVDLFLKNNASYTYSFDWLKRNLIIGVLYDYDKPEDQIIEEYEGYEVHFIL